MPPRKRASSVLNGDALKLPQAAADDTPADLGHGDALSLAEEAEAEAQAAEADAAAARARARALKLRRQAAAAKPATPPVEPERVQSAEPVEPAEPAETAEPAEPTAPYVSVLTGSDADTAAIGDDPDAAAESTDTESTDTESTDTDDAADEPEPSRGRRRRVGSRLKLTWLAGALLVLCTVGCLVASGFMIVHHRQVAAEQQRTAEFAAAARQGVVTLMSLNFNSAKDDVKKIIENTTGDFKKDFEGQADQFADVAQASKVITEATVNATAVQTMTDDTATVLVAVTTQVSNAASKEPQPRSWRLRVDVARDGGQIKLAKVEFVP